jgi:hypothetical protein
MVQIVRHYSHTPHLTTPNILLTDPHRVFSPKPACEVISVLWVSTPVRDQAESMTQEPHSTYRANIDICTVCNTQQILQYPNKAAVIMGYLMELPDGFPNPVTLNFRFIKCVLPFRWLHGEVPSIAQEDCKSPSLPFINPSAAKLCF